MARFAHIVFGFAVALLLAGCSRDAESQADDSLYWTPPGEDDLMPGHFAPLSLQLSVDPVVYISHIPEEQELSEIEQEEGVIVMPSTFDDMFPRIVAFQAAQEAAGKTAVVMIDGDDRALCGSILKAIDCAKRARVKFILFATGTWWTSGMAFKMHWCGAGIKYFEFPKGFEPSRELANNIVTLTISKEGVIHWGNAPLTREELVNVMHDLMRNIGIENALLVIHVDPDAPFPALRKVLNEARRAGVFKVMIAQK